MLQDDTENMKKANAILQGNYEKPEMLLALAGKLKKEKRFGLARKLLNRALQDGEIEKDKTLKLKIGQQHALCTYKDPDLPISDRLDRALKILNKTDDLLKTKNQETLGLAGAIYKRNWEVDGQKQTLERSLYYYDRGYQEGPVNDCGYTGLNAAYVRDQLASLEETQAKAAGTTSALAKERRSQATSIREDLVSVLPGMAKKDDTLAAQYWFLVTIAEAYYGLGRFQEALPWLEKASALPNVPPWEFETTAKQLTSITRLQNDIEGKADIVEESEAWKVLQKFLGDNFQAVRSAFVGKVGLGLSGGGFRASLFHIGVLAKLAELDALRHVEVLSCVSGGSIIGAHYYLELRKLYKEKQDDQISREDYIEIVKRISEQFLAGVQRNIRTRVAAEFTTNLKMIFTPNYSRTERVGELYEEELYARVEDGEGHRPRWLNDLFIRPKGEDKSFAPKHDNWRRAAKVPILILNATTLNTGHNWQFTASWMGEPPVAINTEVDGNYRLRRMYYEDAPSDHKKIRLGHAVAASACVPGLFEPIVLDKLYEDVTVRLVDGGVHDNQGVMGLLEQDCTVIIVSDASGQMETQDDPSRGLIGVPLRSNSILMARVREAEYRELAARRRSSLVRKLVYLHLKKDLEVNPINWLGCKEPSDISDESRPAEGDRSPTSYGIPKDIQERIAGIRTDLDSFSDKEAFALMTSGYRMTEFEFKHQIETHLQDTKTPPDWPFLQVEESMQDNEKSQDMRKLLKVAGNTALKIWLLSKPLKIVGMIIALAAVIAFLAVSFKWPALPLITLGMIGTSLLFFIIGLFVGKTILRIANFRETLTQIAIGVGMSLLGWGAARLHLHVFDKWYLRAGRMDKRI
ncbi:MAG: tetratricopeptide repeat-containing protein [Desulfobacterales bacterium]